MQLLRTLGKDCQGALGLILVLTLSAVSLSLTGLTLFSAHSLSERVVANSEEASLRAALDAVLEEARVRINEGKFMAVPLQIGYFKDLSQPGSGVDSSLAAVDEYDNILHPNFKQRAALTPVSLTTATKDGEYILLARVKGKKRLVRAEVRVALLNTSASTEVLLYSLVTLDNWDESSIFPPYTLSGSLPSLMDRKKLMKATIDLAKYTDPLSAYDANTSCITQDLGPGIYLTSSNVNFFEVSPDLPLPTTTPTPEALPTPFPDCAGYPPVTNQYTYNGLTAAGLTTSAMTASTPWAFAAWYVDPPYSEPFVRNKKQSEMASKTRRLGFPRMLEAFHQAATNPYCSFPVTPGNLKVFEYDSPSPQTISTVALEGNKTNVLVFKGTGPYTVDAVITGHVHMIFTSGTTTFTSNVATIGSLYIMGAGTTVTFNLPPNRQKIAGRLFIFPTDHTNPPVVNLSNVQLYTSLEYWSQGGLEEIATKSRLLQCTGPSAKTRRNNPANPFIFQIKKITAASAI